MRLESSTTGWRGESVLPDDYEDVATLIRLARKARGRIVEFNWAFSLDDLQRLRRGDRHGVATRLIALSHAHLGGGSAGAIKSAPSTAFAPFTMA
jgi:hypothetical protein